MSSDDIELEEVGGGEGEGGGIGTEKYVPLKDRKVKDNQLGSMLECFPNFLPAQRNALTRWYPGPTIMMHKMHWSEWLFVIFTALAVVFLVMEFQGKGIDSGLIAILLSIVSFLGIFFCWGLARFQSLADVADRLENIAMQTHAEVACYSDINDEWEEGLARSADNINQFTDQMGMVTDDAEQISALTDALGQIVEQQKQIQAEEKALFQVSVKHQRVTRADIDEKQRANMKKSIERVFKRLATLDDEGNVAIRDDEGINKLQEALQENEFLNQKKKDKDGNELPEPLYNWYPCFEEIKDDGIISCWELLDAIDECTDAYFLEIRDAIKNSQILKDELDDLKRQAGKD